MIENIIYSVMLVVSFTLIAIALLAFKRNYSKRMLVLGLVAATGVSTRNAVPKMHPSVSHLQAVLTATIGHWIQRDVLEVLTWC